MGPARFHCATLLYVGVLASSLNQEVTSKQNKQGDGKDKPEKKTLVRSGIRTHAHRSGLRPERSALDLSAILTEWREHSQVTWSIVSLVH